MVAIEVIEKEIPQIAEFFKKELEKYGESDRYIELEEEFKEREIRELKRILQNAKSFEIYPVEKAVEVFKEKVKEIVIKKTEDNEELRNKVLEHLSNAVYLGMIREIINLARKELKIKDIRFLPFDYVLIVYADCLVCGKTYNYRGIIKQFNGKWLPNLECWEINCENKNKLVEALKNKGANIKEEFKGLIEVVS